MVIERFFLQHHIKKVPIVWLTCNFLDPLTGSSGRNWEASALAFHNGETKIFWLRSLMRAPPSGWLLLPKAPWQAGLVHISGERCVFPPLVVLKMQPKALQGGPFLFHFARKAVKSIAWEYHGFSLVFVDLSGLGTPKSCDFRGKPLDNIICSMKTRGSDFKPWCPFHKDTCGST